LGSGSDQVTSKSTSQTTGHQTRRCRARAHVPARAQASSVVQCHALRMPPHRRSEVHDPLKPTMGTCAGHCFARAQQCPANPKPPGCTTLPRSACVCARASVAAMQRARPGRPSQAQAPPRPSAPHRPFWSTTGTGRSTSLAHADSARALSASAFGPTARHPSASVPRPRVCWPRSSSAALCRSPPQAPGHGTEPLNGQPPASNGTAHPCAGHCFARAQQCPANPDASLVHQPPPPASVRTQASSAVL
jgi:hypothetical protein